MVLLYATFRHLYVSEADRIYITQREHGMKLHSSMQDETSTLYTLQSTQVNHGILYNVFYIVLCFNALDLTDHQAIPASKCQSPSSHQCIVGLPLLCF